MGTARRKRTIEANSFGEAPTTRRKCFSSGSWLDPEVPGERTDEEIAAGFERSDRSPNSFASFSGLRCIDNTKVRSSYPSSIPMDILTNSSVLSPS